MKKFILALSVVLSLVACKSTIVINQDDAKEIAIDASGYAEDAVKDIKIANGNGYDVEFTTDGGEYKYHIGTDGIITQRSIKSYTSLDDEDVIEKKEKIEEEIEESEDELDEEAKSKAISAALTNLGLREAQVKDIEVEVKDDTISVKCTVIVNGNQFETIINPTTGRVESSYITQ